MGFILIAIVLWVGFDYLGSELKRIADSVEKQDRIIERYRAGR